MSEDVQILFMQARIVRLASRRWNKSLNDVATLLLDSGALAYIRDSFDYFHLEGDDAVLDDVEDYLSGRGLSVHAIA